MTDFSAALKLVMFEKTCRKVQRSAKVSPHTGQHRHFAMNKPSPSSVPNFSVSFFFNKFTFCVLFCVQYLLRQCSVDKSLCYFCREVNKFVSVYCFHMQANIMVLLRRMQKQLWNIANQLVTQLPMWNYFISGCFILL